MPLTPPFDTIGLDLHKRETQLCTVAADGAVNATDAIATTDALTATREITALLKRYETSLNTSDAALAASCFTSDGLFMPTALPTAEGGAMQDAYVQTFAAIRLRVTFAVDELVVASEDVAFARTRSSGTQTILASGASGAESNRELFIFRVEHGAWKIARDMFNKSH